MDYSQAFIQYLSYEKRFSPHTVLSYQADLIQFTNYIKENNQTDDYTLVNHLLVRSWIVSMMDGGISARTVNRKITTLKTFYKFMLRQGVMKENPMLKIQSPKTAKRLPTYVEKDKMDLLLDKVDFGEGYEAVMNKLIVIILYLTGMRLSELLNLKNSDIDMYSQTIKVLGKRNKERIIPINKLLKDELGNFLNQKKDLSINDNNTLLVNSKGKMLYEKYIYRVVKEYLSQVTTIDKRSPHVLRHTFATHMLNNGADLNSIKELLGHANLSATQVYTHNTVEKLKSIHKQAHPKA